MFQHSALKGILTLRKALGMPVFYIKHLFTILSTNFWGRFAKKSQVTPFFFDEGTWENKIQKGIYLSLLWLLTRELAQFKKN